MDMYEECTASLEVNEASKDTMKECLVLVGHIRYQYHVGISTMVGVVE